MVASDAPHRVSILPRPLAGAEPRFYAAFLADRESEAAPNTRESCSSCVAYGVEIGGSGWTSTESQPSRNPAPMNAFRRPCTSVESALTEESGPFWRHIENADTQTGYVEVASNAFDSLAIRGRAAAVQPRQHPRSSHHAIQTGHEVPLHPLDGVSVHIDRHRGPAVTHALGHRQQVPSVCQEHGDVTVAERVEFDAR